MVRLLLKWQKRWKSMNVESLPSIPPAHKKREVSEVGEIVMPTESEYRVGVDTRSRLSKIHGGVGSDVVRIRASPDLVQRPIPS